MPGVQLLYTWVSPFAMRVEMALAFKQVEYEKLPQDLLNKSQLLQESNPVYKKVPVLIHEGKPICESSIIVQYVDEAWPSPEGFNLLPSDPYERAIARFWGDYVDKKVFDPIFGILTSKDEDRNMAIENALIVMDTLEEAFGNVPKEPPFFGGANIGFLDIMLGPLIVCLPALEDLGHFTLHLEEKPRLHAWFMTLKQHPISYVLPMASKISDFVSQAISKGYVKFC